MLSTTYLWRNFGLELCLLNVYLDLNLIKHVLRSYVCFFLKFAFGNFLLKPIDAGVKTLRVQNLLLFNTYLTVGV